MLFRKEALESNRRKLDGSVILIQPISLKVYFFVLVTISILGLSLLLLTEFSRKESVPGFLSSDKGTSVIGTDKGGMVSTVYVKVGDKVNKGDKLFEIDTGRKLDEGTLIDAQLKSINYQLKVYGLQSQTLKKEYNLKVSSLDEEKKSLELELKSLTARRRLYNKAYETAKSRAKKYERLEKNEVVSTLELENAKANSLAKEISLSEVDHQLLILKKRLKTIRTSQREIVLSHQKSIQNTSLQINQLKDRIIELNAAEKYLVKSPLSGTVTAVQGFSGQQISRNTQMVMVLPNNSKLEAKLLAPSSAIGFIKIGQEVKLNLDAFPYQKFGSKTGVIREISSSPFKPGELMSPISHSFPVYVISVELESQEAPAYGTDVPLKPGLSLTGDIFLEKRTIMQWILDPLYAIRK